MAEEPVTKWWAVGAKDESTVRKYISFLHKHSMFGGHVGLPENIRNEDPNRSLDSARGIYDMVEVYSLSGTSCPTGTVVNFLLDNPVNPIGKTYVYPCNDTSKPMGYMVTKTEPNIWGVCVVSGILEVPLIYLRNTSSAQLERKDYVEYDLESKAFKFSDSGYPVFNVYQDVDGDWIAIILFGNTSSESWKYDGPFAASITGITGSTLYVDIAEGDFIHENIRHTFDDLTLMTDIALSSGESLWLNVYLDGATCSYAFQSLSNPPTQTLGGSLWYRIADYYDGEVKQIQYGDIFNDIQHIKVEGVTGSTAYIHLTGYSSSNASENNLMLRGIGCSFSTLGQNDISIIVDGSTGGGGGEVQSLYSSVTGGTPSINITGNTSYVNIVGGTNAKTRVGSDGEIIVDLDLNVDKFIYSGEFAISGVTSSGGYLYMNIEAGTVVVGNQRYPVPSETGFRISYGENLCLLGRYENGNPEFDYLSVDSPDEYSVSENSFLVVIGRSVGDGVKQIQYGEITTVTWGSIVSLTGLTSSLSGNSEAVVSLYGGGTGSFSLYAGDNVSFSVGSSNEIHINANVSGGTGTVTGITSSVSSNSATVSTVGGTGSVVFIGALGTTISTNSNNEVVIGSTYSETPQDLSASVSGTTASIGITDGTGFSLIPEGDAYVRSSSNGFILGSTHTPDYQNLTSASTTDGFTVGLSNSTSSVTLTGGTNVTITSGTTGEFIINASGNVIQSISIKPIGDTSIPAFYLTDDTDYVEVVGGTGITTAIDNGKLLIESTVIPGDENYEIIEGTGIDISDETETVNNVATPTGNKIISVETGYTVAVASNTASITFEGSTNSVYFKAGTNVGLDSGGTNIITISATGGGSTQDLSASVSNGTASISLVGGTGSVNIVGTGGVTISGNTETGNIEINATGGTGSSGGISLLEINWTRSYAFELYKDIEYWTGYDEDTPQGYSQIGNGYGGIIVGTIQGPSSVTSYGDGYSSGDDADSYRFEIQMNPLNEPVTNISLLHPKKTEVIIGSDIGYCYSPRQVSVWLVVPPNTEFKLIETPSPNKSITGSSYSLQFYPYNLLEQPEPEPEPVDYRVMQTSGNNIGSLFYGLSQRNDSNISVDSSLDGQSIDFEGASVL